MALGRWQATIVNDKGDILPGASVEVRREVAGSPLATLYSDRDGLTPLGNPLTVGLDGYAAFHAVGGAYRITATKDGFSRTWRYVPVGIGSEQDRALPGIVFTFDDATADADPGAGIIRFNNATLASVTQLFINDVDFFGINQAAFMQAWDDFGGTSNRGYVILQSASGSAWLIGQITGTVTDATDYKKVTITVVASGGSFLPDQQVSIVFTASGTNGTNGTNGLFTGTETQVAAAPDDLIPVQDASDSNNPKRVAASTVGTGKQTIWVPASAMKIRTIGPATGSFSAGSTQFDYLAFDPGTNEDATFTVAMPKGWDHTTAVTYLAYWLHPATTTNFGVVWEMFAKAYSDDDAIDGASYTSLGTVTDTGGTTSDLYISTEGAGAAVSGAAQNDLVNFIIRRVGGNGSDTLAVDAYLIGVKVLYTTNANVDN